MLNLSKLFNKSMTWIIFILIGFGFVYSQSLTFVYVEGDDATSILHHVLGRNTILWPRYSPYHSMMDALLEQLPPSEQALRIFSISISALSAISFSILTMQLIFQWLEIEDNLLRVFLGLLILCAVPELFFLGLIYNPSLLSMTFILSSHIIIRNIPKIKLSKLSIWHVTKFFLSLLLFCNGVSFRWSLVLYGLVIVCDLVFFKFNFKSISKKI